jgi:hypothetical protein
MTGGSIDGIVAEILPDVGGADACALATGVWKYGSSPAATKAQIPKARFVEIA